MARGRSRSSIYGRSWPRCRQQYGRSSERLDAEIAQLELRLEDLEESEAERQAAIPGPSTPTESPKPRAKAVRRPLPDHLARETIVHEPEMVCGGCNRSKLARLGEDVTEVLEKIRKRQPIPALLFRVQVGLVWDGLKFHGSSASSALLRWRFAMRSITAAI